MNSQAAFQNLLRDRFAELQAKNARYSLRAYADRIGIHPGALSSIMNGRRAVSLKIVKRVANRLMLNPSEEARLLKAFSAAEADGGELERNRPQDWLTLAAHEFKVMADWEHKAILSLLNTKFVFKSSEQITARLGLPTRQIENAIDRLKLLKLIKQTSSGRFVRVAKPLKTSNGINDSAIRKAHGQSLDLAKTALQDIPVAHRDIRSITFAIDTEKIPQAQALIDEFHDRLSELLESGSRTEVYRFTTALFPLTTLQSEGISDNDQP